MNESQQLKMIEGLGLNKHSNTTIVSPCCHSCAIVLAQLRQQGGTTPAIHSPNRRCYGFLTRTKQGISKVYYFVLHLYIPTHSFSSNRLSLCSLHYFLKHSAV